MTEVILLNWREGLEKISLTKLQMEKLGLTLKESKNNVDNLLDDKQIVLQIANYNIAMEFAEEAEKIGASCKVIKDV